MVIDLRKAVRLADELIGELEAQGQDEGDLGEALSQFVTEADEIIESGDKPSEVDSNVAPSIAKAMREREQWRRDRLELLKAIREHREAGTLGGWKISDEDTALYAVADRIEEGDRAAHSRR